MASTPRWPFPVGFHRFDFPPLIFILMSSCWLLKFSISEHIFIACKRKRSLNLKGNGVITTKSQKRIDVLVGQTESIHL